MQKSEVIEFLEKIDAHIKQKHAAILGDAKLELKIIGKCALLLAGMTDPIGTVDLDSLCIEGGTSAHTNQTIADSLLEEFGRPRQTIHGYYLEFVAPAIVFLPQRPQWLDLEGKWQNLAVMFLERHENIASKCFSAFSTPPRKKDRQDIGAALDQKLVGLKDVLNVADRIFDFYSMDARNDRFPAVYKYITEELIPNYGGGKLKYVPPEE